MKKLILTAFCAMLLSGALFSCKYFPSDPEHRDSIRVPINNLLNTYWKLEGYSFINKKAHAINITEPFGLNFPDRNNAGGGASCNSYTMEYKADEKNISFRNLTTSKEYCGDESFAPTYYKVLENADSYLISDGRLSIISAKSDIVLHFRQLFTTPRMENPIQLLETFNTVDFRIDPFRILDIKKADETHLYLTVEYGGGCVEEHGFYLFGSKEFRTGSNTDIAEIMMTHDAKGDGCKALLTKTIAFDMSPLLKAQRESGSSNKLTLKFSQFPNGEAIIYEF